MGATSGTPSGSLTIEEMNSDLNSSILPGDILDY
jgi:hypothetical protein